MLDLVRLIVSLLTRSKADRELERNREVLRRERMLCGYSKAVSRGE